MRGVQVEVGRASWSLVLAGLVLACSSDVLAPGVDSVGQAPSGGGGRDGSSQVPGPSGPAAAGRASASSDTPPAATGVAGATEPAPATPNAGSGASSSTSAGAENGGARTSDGAPATSGGTNDGTGAGGNTGDGQAGGNTGDGQGGGNTGDGARGGDTGDGARGGGTGDGCLPTCFPSALDDVNVIALNDATADGADVEGRMYVAHDANFPSYAIGTHLAPDPTRADLVVGHDLYFGGGSVANGKVSYEGELLLGAASTLGGYHQESIIDFAAVEQELTADSARLAALAPNGTVENTVLEVRLTGTDPTLNVFELQAADLANMTSLILTAPASSSAVVNIRGESVSLHDFGFSLTGIVREQILYNLPDATSLTLSGVGIQGSLLAPYVDLAFANGHIDGQLVVRNFSGSGESHPKFFVGCLPLCQL
jgi:choice-of-anchor A domain-containing protein